MNIRPPSVAGRFYPGDKRSLGKMMDALFSRAGGIPKTMDGPLVRGVVVPHAGFVYSGVTAARSYNAIAHGFDNVESFIILGPSHSGLGYSVSISRMDFDTPFGVVKNDEELTNLLLSQNDLIRLSEDAHIFEHSIEVQLPFLQYVAGFAEKEFTFTPIALSTQFPDDIKVVGEAIYQSIVRSGKKVVVVASSDFTHIGSAYGFLPCPKNQIVDWMHDHDSLALERIRVLDIEGFLKVKDEYNLSICGAGPIGVLIHYARMAGAEKADIVHYTTSYETSRSLSGVVGYASIVIK